LEVIVLPWKDPSSNAFFSWIYIILFGAWGGLVRYLLDVKSGQSGRNLFAALAQIIVSGFTGVLAGLMSQSLGQYFILRLRLVVYQVQWALSPLIITGRKSLERIMINHEFSKTTERNLKGVHKDLSDVMRKALKLSPIDFGISEGLRTQKRQLELLASGKSLTSKSRHLTGHAVDIFAVINGTASWEFKHYQTIATAVFQAARELNVDVEWGGNWTEIKDGVHFQLSRKMYP
jgi:peptidoglycan L-alanyl-D-glutamate endopeptidase CwlK